MSDVQTEVRDKMRRSLNLEFTRMEDDFDTTRDHRAVLTGKLMAAAESITIVGEKGAVSEETPIALAVIDKALKALNDTEKSNEKAISLKLRRSEAEVASAAATRDRIAIVLKATSPGRIEETFPADKLDEHLSEMFEGTIQDFELKTNPKSLDESEI